MIYRQIRIRSTDNFQLFPHGIQNYMIVYQMLYNIIWFTTCRSIPK